jgi:hypothetical protein
MKTGVERQPEESQPTANPSGGVAQLQKLKAERDELKKKLL